MSMATIMIEEQLDQNCLDTSWLAALDLQHFFDLYASLLAYTSSDPLLNEDRLSKNTLYQMSREDLPGPTTLF